MEEVLQRIREHQMLRPAIAAPIAIMIIFSLFNLTAAPDQSRVPAAVTLGIVNLDEGAPGTPAPVSEQLVAGMQAGLPVGSARYADAAVARTALDDGEISAFLVFPAEFSRQVLSQGSVDVSFVASQHLSLAETQLAGTLSRQLQASLSAAIAGIRLANATGGAPEGGAPGAAAPPPGANVTVEFLYAATTPAALSAPFVMTFATWIAAFVGALMAFLATRPVKGPETTVPVSGVRTILPIAVTGVASLALAVTVAWTTDNWDEIVAIWLFAWLASAALTLLIAGLFAVLSFFAILVVLPAVFYQSALSGTQIPVEAAPDWLRSIADALPFSELGTGYRALVIGGPDGSMPILLLIVTAVIGVALIWAGTWFYHRLSTSGAVAANG
jgi:ABC-2 type transport system permease protein